MTIPVRPRRSVLYMPGSNPRALEKAKTLAADGLIFDLEDAVAPDAKTAARGQVAAAIRTGGYGRREIIVRVNGLYTPWGRADLAGIANSGAHAVLLPKVESAATILETETMLRQSGAPDDLAIWCMMETPRGILRAEEVANASPRVTGFVMGTSDLAKDLHARHTPDRLAFVAALGHIMLVARAYNLVALDGVHLDLDDDAEFEAQCRQGLAFGFDGKTLIHPKTIATANTVFAPPADEVAWSRKIIAAHAAATAESKGVVLVDGKLVERLHVDNAERIVALAHAIDALENQS